MTSTPFTSGVTDADEHPDVVDISALMEGVVAPEREAELRAHLLSCELCADVRGSLEDIRDTLGTLPGPARMPRDVADRIGAALAAEALLSASPRGRLQEEEGQGHVSRETSLSTPAAFAKRDARTAGTPAPDGEETGEPRDRHGTGGQPHFRPTPRLARASSPLRSPAAVSRETGASRPSTRRNEPTGPGRIRSSRTARRWRTSLLTTAAAVAVCGLGGLFIHSLSPSGSGPTDGGGNTTADAALQHHVQHLLKGTAKTKDAAAPHVTSGKSGSGNSPMAGGESTVPTCIRRGIDRTEDPLAVEERSHYEDRSGYLVVLPHRGGTQHVDAYLVDSSCISHSDTGPAKVLLKRTYPRP